MARSEADGGLGPGMGFKLQDRSCGTDRVLCPDDGHGIDGRRSSGTGSLEMGD